MPRERKLFTEGYREMRLKAVSGMMLTLLLTFTLSTSTSMCQSTLVEEWVPYVPFSQMVDLKLWVTKGNWYMDISITFPDSGFMISDWGTVKREGCEIWVISEILDWTGYSFHVITIISHTYELGRLEDGNYTFTFMARDYLWVVRVKSINLTVVEVVEPTTWTVDDDGPAHFHTIQDAINAADSEDTIFVHSGTYYENVVANKTVSLIGENKTTTIIDGNGKESALLISRTQNVSADSFTIRNGIFGVVLDDSSYICFRNVDLVGSEYNFRFHGIFWEHFSHDIDTSNTVNYKPIYYWVNKQDKEVPIDAGYVALINCSRIVMRNLNLEHNYDGITLFNVRNSRVENVSISNTLHGLYLRGNCTNNIIQRNFMTNNSAAIVLQGASSNNNVTGNIITNNNDGVGVDRSLSNSLSRNFIANNENGILLFETRNNIISENDVVNNTWGIRIQDAYNNSIYHNNFINNEYQVYLLSGYTISTNLWDDGYPCGGNYWSDYFGLDLYGGPHQNETGSDGIGDTPYVIGENNRDNYPLMKPWSPAIIATIDLDPDTLNLKSKGRWITCYIELPEGYDVSDIDRATILLNDTIPVDPFWVDKPLESVIGDYDNDTAPDFMVKFNRAVVIEYLFYQNITYGNVTLRVTGDLYDGTLFERSDMIMAKMSSKAIEKIPSEVDSDDEHVPVMPEFPSFVILPLFMIVTLLAVIVYRRKQST